MNADAKRALDVRRLRVEGWTHAQIARHFKMSVNQVGKICRGEAWAKLTGGEAILTDGEAQLRLLTNGSPPAGMPSPEEQSAAIARLLKVQEEAQSQGQHSDIPEQYKGVDPTANPEAYRRIVQQMIEEGRRRTANNGSPPPPVPVRYPAKETPTGAINAEKLLETLKDEHIDSGKE